ALAGWATPTSPGGACHRASPMPGSACAPCSVGTALGAFAHATKGTEGRRKGDNAMKKHMIRTFFAAGVAGGMFSAPAVAPTADPRAAPAAAPRPPAGDRHSYIFDSLCIRPAAGPNTGGADEASPTPSVFHAEPVKVFDNLYFVGEKEYSAWAVITSE